MIIDHSPLIVLRVGHNVGESDGGLMYQAVFGGVE